MIPRTLVCLLLLGSAAYAQPADDTDTIVTRDGSILRGHVTEMHPGQSVSLVLLNGETRIIQWGDIARSTGPSFPGTTPPPAPPLTPPPSPPPYGSESLLMPGPGRVPLEVYSATDKHISVGVPTGGATAIVGGYYGGAYAVSIESYQRLCDAPCTLFVRPGYFRLSTNVDGNMLYGTDIDVPAGGVRVKMRTPSRWRTWGGVMLISGGLGVAIVGVTIAIIGGQFAYHLDNNFNRVYDDPTPYYAGGAVLGVGGAAMMAGGIAMVATNRRGVAERQDLNCVPGGGQSNVHLAPNLATIRF